MGISTKNNFNITRQGGFSIIELMIALSLGLLVLFAVLQVFTTSLQSVNLQNAFSRVQENGRMSTQMLSRDIRAAGFWGCTFGTSGELDDESILLDDADSDYTSSLVLPIGADAVTVAGNVSSAKITAISAITGASVDITVKDTTDTLTLRGVRSFSDVQISQIMSDTAAVINITPYTDKDEVINLGDILLIDDCTTANLFTNTQDQPFENGEIGHSDGEVTGAIKNTTGLLSKAYGLSAQIYAPYVKTYFIGENSTFIDEDTPGGYSLYRTDNGTASELVRGVKDLQFTYDATTGSIRVELVAESGTLEKTYRFTVNIRNS